MHVTRLGRGTKACCVYRLVQGPVSSLASVEGSLVVAYGRRVDLYAWTTGARLQRVAFYDASVEVTCLATIKAFLVVGDALKGLAFLSTSQGSRQLTHVSKVAPCGPNPP